MSIRKRLKGDTPRFFKNLGIWGYALVALGGTLSAPALGIPLVVGGVIAAVGGTMKLVSSLVVKNPNDLN